MTCGEVNSKEAEDASACPPVSLLPEDQPALEPGDASLSTAFSQTHLQSLGMQVMEFLWLGAQWCPHTVSVGWMIFL